MSASHPWGVEISYSTLKAYLDCPWLHKLRYVDGLRTAPTPASAAGLSLHGALETYHAGRGESLEDLTDALEERWVHEGFSTAQEQMEWHAKAEAALKVYWDAERGNFGRIVCVERDFSFPLGPHRVRGKIDRIDRLDDGTFEVVDYKTHREAISEADVARDLQLRIYALGLKEGLKMEPARLSICYVSLGRRVSVPYEPSGEDELKSILIRAADAISSEEEPRPDHSFCPRCPLRERCRRGLPA